MNQKENKKIAISQKGSVAVFALILMFILAVATIGIITTATIERKTSISTGNSTTAFQIAESGMEKTLQYFKSNFSGTLNDINGTTNCSGGIVKYDPNRINTIRFKDNAEAYITNCADPISKVKIIKSIGTTNQETRAIEENVFLAATKLLLHLNGKNESGNFADSSFYYDKNPISASSGVSAPASPAKFGGGSAEFNGTNGYLSVPDSDSWTFGTGDFTIDFWVNFNDLENGGNQQNIIAQSQSGSNWWFIYKAPTSFPLSNQLGIAAVVNGSSRGGFQMSSSWSGTTAGNWYHLAFVRKGTTGYIFINGVSQALKPYTLGDWADIAAPLYIGRWSVGSGYFVNGYMDEVRISKGVARWTSDFSSRLPTAEYWPD